jgi:hypothetical protein
MKKKLKALYSWLKKNQLYNDLKNPLFSMASDIYDTPHLKSLYDSDRYIIERREDDDRESYRYYPKGMEEWKEDFRMIRDPDTGRTFKGRPIKWDPEISDIEPTEDKWGRDFKTTLREGWFDDVPQNDKLIFRGMSWEEWQGIKETGIIKSKGDYNIGSEQEGLTYFTTDSGSATHYSSGFAPIQYQATPNKPAIVIGIPKREGVAVEGTAEHEVGLPGDISAKEIVEVWLGQPYYAGSHGTATVTNDSRGRRDSSRSPNSITLAWKQII